MKSAARPFSSTPILCPSAMKRAVTSVAARSASAGVKPRCSTKISSSRACHSPYGVTAKPESVPVNIGTPALRALRKFSHAISNSVLGVVDASLCRRRLVRLGEIDNVAQEGERRADRAA